MERDILPLRVGSSSIGSRVMRGMRFEKACFVYISRRLDMTYIVSYINTGLNKRVSTSLKSFLAFNKNWACIVIQSNKGLVYQA